MNKFEMPKMDIAKFSKENIITTSGGGTSVITAAGQAKEVLMSSSDTEFNVFEFNYPAE